jgi:hypothetical protein
MDAILEAYNGNILIKGTHLTPQQRTDLRFRGMSDNEWVECHSFWFKDGRPSNEEGYLYPVCQSLKFLPY